MPTAALLIRPSHAGDLAAMRRIHADAVLHGASRFELEPPDLDAVARRDDAVRAPGLPWPQAHHGGQVLGCTGATPFRARPADRYCLEDSIYPRRGIGRALLAAHCWPNWLPAAQPPVRAICWRSWATARTRARSDCTARSASRWAGSSTPSAGNMGSEATWS